MWFCMDTRHAVEHSVRSFRGRPAGPGEESSGKVVHRGTEGRSLVAEHQIDMELRTGKRLD